MTLTATITINNAPAETELRAWLVADYGMDPAATDQQVSALLTQVARDLIRVAFKQRRQRAALDTGTQQALDRLDTLVGRIQ